MSEPIENPPVVAKKLHGVYVPKAEKSEHRAYYSFYEKLGKTRSLPRVAKEFGKSVAFISTLSRAFRWQERLQQSEKEIKDPVVIGTRSKVDASRVKIVTVVDDVSDTLYEMALLSRKIKASEDGSMAPVDEARALTLLKALRVFGFDINKPRDLRDLISVLKDVVDFQTGEIPTTLGKTDVHIEKILIVKDLD